ncbi:GyrI-like domain-containing protein [Paradevosia shaoguanensis]|uniref:GyrI-like domain-containing protein n=1 Tax=Paradevosia shaoguanensis TaxID=1335043 RepID=UPI001933361B|nr:GyrI-like domain-containing protein [Paradevosia shaoguanensis]
MSDKIDFRKSLKTLYQPSAKAFELIEVPAMQFVMVDGAGNPNTAEAYKHALEWLYATSYALKFAVRHATGQDYVVPPLEGLWWSEDMESFIRRDKDRWRWAMMIMAPDFASAALYETAVEKARGKLGENPASLRLERYEEGLSVQILHIGSYDDEGPTLAQLHDEFMPQNGLVATGHHHEIYLSDARKTAPEKLKTILRQPVARA